MPVYNEAKTVKAVVENVLASPIALDKEIIVVDDGSTDGCSRILQEYSLICKIIYFPSNRGKGAAVRAGLKVVTGDIIIIQDADLEYNPADYPDLLEPILDGRADVVYGSRFITAHPRRVIYFSHYVANNLVTFLSNVFTGLNISDMETGYKVLTRKAVSLIEPYLKANRFGIEPEITAQVARHKLKVYEVGISYAGRTYDEGKKITWRDGLAAMWHIIRFNLFP